MDRKKDTPNKGIPLSARGRSKSVRYQIVAFTRDAEGRVLKRPVVRIVRRAQRDYSAAVKQAIVGRMVVATKGSINTVRIPSGPLAKGGKISVEQDSRKRVGRRSRHIKRLCAT